MSGTELWGDSGGWLGVAGGSLGGFEGGAGAAIDVSSSVSAGEVVIG